MSTGNKEAAPWERASAVVRQFDANLSMEAQAAYMVAVIRAELVAVEAEGYERGVGDRLKPTRRIRNEALDMAAARIKGVRILAIKRVDISWQDVIDSHAQEHARMILSLKIPEVTP